MKKTVWLWSIKYTSSFLYEGLLNLIELIQALLSHAEAAQVMIQMVPGTGFPYAHAQRTMRVLTPAERLDLWKPHEVLMIPEFLPCYDWRSRYSIEDDTAESNMKKSRCNLSFMVSNIIGSFVL